jgi:uracil-DNA glycosylase
LAKGREAPIAFGNGSPNALALLITGRPVFKGTEIAVPYGTDTECGTALKKIWNKAGIDPMDWYHVPAYMCRTPTLEVDDSPVDREIEYITACKDRLVKTVESLSPRIVVLGGYTATIAFFGPEKGFGLKEKVGPIECDNFTVIKTYDLEKFYIASRTQGSEWTSDMSSKILKHWENISEIIRQNKANVSGT